MLAFLRRFSEIIVAIVVIFICILLVGYQFGPNLVEKYASMCLWSTWVVCRHETGNNGDVRDVLRADRFQEAIENSVQSFFGLFGEATTQILTDNGGKKSISYEKDEINNVFLPRIGE